MNGKTNISIRENRKKRRKRYDLKPVKRIILKIKSCKSQIVGKRGKERIRKDKRVRNKL